jgi:uncharacterized protein with ParB-like and HNH nuclease domain
MQEKKIRAEERPLYKILNEDFIFQIPRYQRPYSWEYEEANTLLSDLTHAINTNGNKSVDELDEYFLGSIVLIKGDNPDAQILDGQQRLTTITILFAVLRHLMDDKRFADDITKLLYDKGNHLLGTDDRYRLILRNKDADFFQTYIQTPKGLEKLEELKKQLPDSQTLIKNNALHFLNELSEEAKKNPDFLPKLASYIMKKCILVVVATPNIDSAYRIFSVMNDRGKDLTNSDILKAEIIGKIGSEKEDAYTEKWEDIEESLGRDSFETLFAHVRMIHIEARARESILKEIRNKIKPSENPKDFIDNTLVPFSKAYKVLTNASYSSVSKSEEINEIIKFLHMVDNFDWQPPAILFFANHFDEPDKLLEFLVHLDRLSMALMITRADINRRAERYGRLLKAIKGNIDLYANDSPILLSQQEKSEVLLKLNGDLYNQKKIRLAVLLRLDSALSAGGASYKPTYQTIEHVLPQNPDDKSQWTKWWPDQMEREAYTHKIGNLVLLDKSKNSEAQNFDFKKKKNIYFKSKNKVPPYQITTQVLHAEEWTPDIVKERQETMISTLGKLWELNLDFPIIINIKGIKLTYNPSESYWLSENDEEALWLQNDAKDCPPDDWEGIRAIAQLDEDQHESLIEGLKQFDFFKRIKVLDILLNRFSVLGHDFVYSVDNESWYTEDDEYGIFLYNGNTHVALWEWSGEKLVTNHKLAVNNIEKFNAFSTFRKVNEIVFEE